MELAMADSRGLRWTSLPWEQNGRKGDPYITALRGISSVNDLTQSVAMLRIDIEREEILSALERSVAVNGQLVYLVCDNGEMIACNDAEEYARLSQSLETAEHYWKNLDKTYEPVELSGQRYYAACGWIESAHSYMVSLIPESSINSRAVRMQSTMLVAMLAVFLLAGILFIMFSQSIVRKIHLLQDTMAGAEKGQLRKVELSGRDEIGRMAGDYNRMVDRIQRLMSEQFEMGKKMTRTELMALQSQINPHFLYNTLEMIQWMAREGEVDEVQQMVAGLTSYYRLVLSNGKETVPLNTELQMCREYVNLQNHRFDGSITLKVDEEQGAGDCILPKITLQPLVENAIYHGIREKDTGKGTIVISCRLEENMLVIRVADDGIGTASPEEMPVRSHSERTSSGSGYGMKNIEQRLCLFFEIRSALLFESVPGVGTTVTIRVPARKKE